MSSETGEILLDAIKESTTVEQAGPSLVNVKPKIGIRGIHSQTHADQIGFTGWSDARTASKKTACVQGGSHSPGIGFTPVPMPRERAGRR